jgi:hypothetical protein
VFAILFFQAAILPSFSISPNCPVFGVHYNHRLYIEIITKSSVIFWLTADRIIGLEIEKNIKISELYFKQFKAEMTKQYPQKKMKSFLVIAESKRYFLHNQNTNSDELILIDNSPGKDF